ncbi:MAG: hypothetical protein JNL49_05835 [Bacteroidia bacterium]|nr:hypothetical protein [Bacteroidia bacterium]
MKTSSDLSYDWHNKPQNLLYWYRVYDMSGNVIGHLGALVIYNCHIQNQWVAVLSQYGGFSNVYSSQFPQYLSIPFNSDCEEKIVNRISKVFPEYKFELQV